jgi:hypothetical protein
MHWGSASARLDLPATAMQGPPAEVLQQTAETHAAGAVPLMAPIVAAWSVTLHKITPAKAQLQPVHYTLAV